MSHSRPAASHSLLLGLRALGAVLLAAMAGIHLYLWSVGYRDIDWIGPLFLVNVLAGVVLALAVLAPPRRWPGVAAALGAMLQAGTLGGLVLSVWVGLFGFVETTRATLFWPSVVVEAAGAVVLAVLAVLEYTGARAPAEVPDRMRSG
jgi:hypothetical protein